MSEGSASTRERRKQETSHRIHVCALRLTDERGLDGWTMDDLAEAADVSRRTLFNYVPGKVDAVLGRLPELPEAQVAAFTAGGPHGRVLDDLCDLARRVLEEQDYGRDVVALRRHVLMTTPRLLPLMHERVEALFAEATDIVLAREGTGYGVRRARLAVRVLVCLVDAAIDAMLEGSERPLTEHLDDALRDAHALLA